MLLQPDENFDSRSTELNAAVEEELDACESEDGALKKLDDLVLVQVNADSGQEGEALKGIPGHLEEVAPLEVDELLVELVAGLVELAQTLKVLGAQGNEAERVRLEDEAAAEEEVDAGRELLPSDGVMLQAPMLSEGLDEDIGQVALECRELRKSEKRGGQREGKTTGLIEQAS